MVRYCGAEHLLRSGKLKIVWRHQDDPSVARTRTWNKFSISQFLLWKMSRFSGSELYRICQNLLEDFVWLKASEVFWYELILSTLLLDLYCCHWQLAIRVAKTCQPCQPVGAILKIPHVFYFAFSLTIPPQDWWEWVREQGGYL